MIVLFLFTLCFGVYSEFIHDKHLPHFLNFYGGVIRAKPPNVKTLEAKLKADKVAGEIVLDTQTSLLGVPAAAWAYRLGNRSALEWVLERYRERTPKDKTVAERFNTYRFADYKEDVVLLLGRVCAVSVATAEIVAEMAGGG